MKKMELYSGFEWAVPRAFGSALHSCRFEQGDVLYSDPFAYDESKRGKRLTGYHVQVLDPPRISRAVAVEGEGQRFFSNWESPVEFEWMDYRKGKREERQASQGGLFTCLWKGDPDALREDRRADLLRPRLNRELQSCVADCTSAMVEQFDRMAPSRVQKKRSASRRRLFAMTLDQSSDASRVKALAIGRALAAKFETSVREFFPVDLGLADAEQFHPALRLLGIAVSSCDDEAIEGVLRDVLYAGGKAAGKEGGRFQLARHGSLVPFD
jgi:hypothetical protein